ncbi:MAG: cytochrome c biogenesis protein CcdA [Ignavibacteriaceae bacterium]|nr:cytochrome c biogenesis protein CcdA [Ignavibacteriaceae bacterium]
MIEDIFTYLTMALYENFYIAILASFGWGILSILLSPCHLSSIPLVIGFINTQGKRSDRSAFSLSLLFSLGILITIALVGVITASLGRIMGDVGVYGNYFVAGIFFIVGLYLLDLININLGNVNIKGVKSKGLVAAFILGLLLGIGLGPCTFAFLALVLGVVFQTAQESFWKGTFLLGAFALGHCAVIVGAGTASHKVQGYLNWTEESRVTLWIRRVCGVLVILAGIYFFTI